MREKCGLVGIRSLKGENVLPMLIDSLRALQHRGQEAWGMAVPGVRPFRWLGLVTEEIRSALAVAESNVSDVAVGHTRYSTVGSTVFENVQPIMIGDDFSIALNGTISNTEELVERISDEFEIPGWASDTTIAGFRLLQLLKRKSGKWLEAFSELSEEMNGAYCFLLLSKNGDLYAARDERGFRPLCLGWHEASKSHIVASESCGLSILGASLVRDIEPGEMVKIDADGVHSSMFAKSERHAHCAFEYTYFAHPSSKIENVNVYTARKRMGRILAEIYKVSGDVVIPVPDSARPAALGFSEATGIPLEEGLMKDRYGKRGGLRSFIQPDVKERIEINRKVIAVEDTVKDKEVILIDDSIVRGTSSKMMVDILRKAGAKKVKLLVTFPPIRHACYAGIDFPTREELVANSVSEGEEDISSLNEKVRQALGLDFAGYMTLEGLARGLGFPLGELCTSCVTGDYSCLKKQPQYVTRMKKS